MGQPRDVVNLVATTCSNDTEHRIRFYADGNLHALSLSVLDHAALRVARHLYARGVDRSSRIGVIAPNCIEWVLLDLAALKLGAIVVGLEPGRFDPVKKIDELGLSLMFVSDETKAPSVHNIAAVQSWAADDAVQVELPHRESLKPHDICALKQTSGSTGVPKAIEVTAGSVNHSLEAVQSMFHHADGDNLLVFLPIRFLQQRFWVYSALANGHDVTLADRATVLSAARAALPTVVMGVPGFYDQLRKQVEATTGPTDLRERRNAIHNLIGNRIRYLWTGSAKASRTTLQFFHDCGIPLYEGYGQNETCIVSKNHPGAYRLGSVGKVLPHKRIRFDHQGVLIVGSDCPVNTKYAWCAPGANEKVFLPDNEVKTFDVGHVDADGYLYIDGRVDDFITLTGALNVCVTIVEEALRDYPEVHECAIVGQGRPFLTAIVSPAGENIPPARFTNVIADLNRRLNYEQRIYGAIISRAQFSPANNMLNGQYKLNRRNIESFYARDIDIMYRTHAGYNDGTTEDISIAVVHTLPSGEGR